MPIPTWSRRGGAFLADYTIFLTLVAVIDNLLYVPIPEILVSLLSLALFCAYFVLWEGVSKGTASPGKRLFKLRVLTWKTDPPSTRSAAVRSLIVGPLVVLTWHEIPLVLPWIPVPIALILILGAAQGSLVLYNIWLSGAERDYQMLQDRWTTTRVVGSSVTTEAAGLEVKLIPHRVGLLTLFVILIAGLTAIATSRKLDLGGVSYGKEAPQWQIQQVIGQQLGVRTRVEIETTFAWSTRQDSSSSTTMLQVGLWIPFARWDEESLERYVEVALSELKVQPGYYDSGQITLWTGGGLLKFSTTFELNLPTPNDGADSS